MPTLTARSTTLTDLPSARPASSSNSLTAFPSSDFTPGSAGGGDGNHPHAVDFTGRELDHALADVQKRRGQFLQVGLRRFVLEFHEFRRIDLIAIIRTRLILPVGNWTTRLRMSRNGAASSSRSASGDSYLSFMSFAASITLPPPSAIIWSALCRLSASTPCMTTLRSGSASGMARTRT